MHSFVLARYALPPGKLPTKFIETKLHFNLFLVSSISVFDLSSCSCCFFSSSPLFCFRCICLSLSRSPYDFRSFFFACCSSFLHRLFASLPLSQWCSRSSTERQRAELNLIVCTNFHLGNKLRRQTHVFRYERNIYLEKKRRGKTATTTSGKPCNCVDEERFLTVILNLNVCKNFSCSKPKSTLHFGLTVRCSRSVWRFQNY